MDADCERDLVQLLFDIQCEGGTSIRMELWNYQCRYGSISSSISSSISTSIRIEVWNSVLKYGVWNQCPCSSVVYTDC